MDVIKRRLTLFLLIILVSSPIFSQNEITFGKKKIKISGTEICSYSINYNSHITKDYLDIKNGILLYSVVEYDQGVPIHIEITECKLTDMDKSSCSIATSDQKSIYTPGLIYILYLYTSADQVSISTTIYDSPNRPTNIQTSSVGRIHFQDLATDENCFDNNFK